MLISFSTNGSLITKQVAKNLKAVENNINYFQVSLYGADSPSYEKVTKNPQGFKLVTKGIQNLIEIGMKPSIFWVLTKDNIDQVEKAYELVSKLGLSELRLSSKLNLGRGKTDCESDPTESIEAWRKTLIILKQLDNMTKLAGSPRVVLHERPLLGEYLYHLTGLPYFFVTCKAATTMIYVNSEGYCSPCPFSTNMPSMYDPLGLSKAPTCLNILENSFSEIWNSDIFMTYRKLQDPNFNPKEIFVKCPHFKSGFCDPCVFTPCTCRFSMELIAKAFKANQTNKIII